jgi:hypothetical protein
MTKTRKRRGNQRKRKGKGQVSFEDVEFKTLEKKIEETREGKEERKKSWEGRRRRGNLGKKKISVCVCVVVDVGVWCKKLLCGAFVCVRSEI